MNEKRVHKKGLEEEKGNEKRCNYNLKKLQKGYDILIKGRTNQEGSTTLNIYAPNYCAPNLIKREPLYLKKKMNPGR